jgi:hypothetical protein
MKINPPLRIGVECEMAYKPLNEIIYEFDDIIHLNGY